MELTNDEKIETLERMVDNYHTNKILQGHGLQDDPEWVMKVEKVLNGDCW